MAPNLLLTAHPKSTLVHSGVISFTRCENWILPPRRGVITYQVCSLGERRLSWDLLRDLLCMEHIIREVFLWNGFAIFVILGVLFFSFSFSVWQPSFPCRLHTSYLGSILLKTGAMKEEPLDRSCSPPGTQPLSEPYPRTEVLTLTSLSLARSPGYMSAEVSLPEPRAGQTWMEGEGGAV